MITSNQRIRYRDDVTRYFLDTEFIEDGKTVDLVSIALVAADGREYYAASADVDLSRASDWVRQHVLPHLPARASPLWKPRAQIRDEIVRFIAGGRYKPELWAYFASYDWLAFCQLFGRMVDLPQGYPMYALDLKQLSVMLGSPPHPVQVGTAHDALEDARWNKQLFAYLQSL